jgi:rRNA maturation RNase YbeY
LRNSIHYHYNDLEHKAEIQEFKLSDWIFNCISKLSKKDIEELNYIFCNDDYLLEINRKYLNHDTLTDIITFNYNTDKHIHGEIYISLERVKENATQLSENFERELKRVIIHGVLHLIGYDDKNKEDKAKMRELEDYCLTLWPEK